MLDNEPYDGLHHQPEQQQQEAVGWGWGMKKKRTNIFRYSRTAVPTVEEADTIKEVQTLLYPGIM